MRKALYVAIPIVLIVVLVYRVNPSANSRVTAFLKQTWADITQKWDESFDSEGSGIDPNKIEENRKKFGEPIKVIIPGEGSQATPDPNQPGDAYPTAVPEESEPTVAPEAPPTQAPAADAPATPTLEPAVVYTPTAIQPIP